MVLPDHTTKRLINILENCTINQVRNEIITQYQVNLDKNVILYNSKIIEMSRYGKKLYELGVENEDMKILMSKIVTFLKLKFLE